MKNEILEELWKSKDEINKEHKNSALEIVRYLNKKGKNEKRRTINLSEKIRRAA